MQREFTEIEATRHNSLTERAWKLAKDHMIVEGDEPRGRLGWFARRKLKDFLPADMERRWRHALGLVSAAQSPLRVHGRMSYADSVWLYQETLLAPLRDAASQLTMFMLVTAWWPTTSSGRDSA